MKKLIGILVLIFVCQTIFAQEFITISGKVTDSETGTALPYASIGIKNAPIGTITNDEGDFTFHIPVNYKNDTLVISMLGYENFKEKIVESNTDKKIALKQYTYNLSEINVNAFTAEDILIKAYKKYKKEYLPDEYLADAYYFEYAMEDTNYVRFLEAAISCYNKGNEFIAGEIKNIRYGKDISRKTPYFENILQMIFLSTTHIMEPDKTHEYSIDTLIMYNNKLCYKISAKETGINYYKNEFSLWQGYIIEYETLKFVQIAWDISYLNPKPKNGKRYDANLKMFTQTFFYDIDNITYPAHSIFITKSRLYKNRDEVQDNFIITQYGEMVINNIQAKNIKSIPKQNQFDAIEDIYKQGYRYNSDFWKYYNIISLCKDYNLVKKLLSQ